MFMVNFGYENSEFVIVYLGNCVIGLGVELKMVSDGF